MVQANETNQPEENCKDERSRPNSLHRERRLYRSSASLHSHGADGEIEDGVHTPLAKFDSHHSINGSIGAGLRSRHSSGKSVRSRLAPPEEYHGDLKPSLKQGLTRNLLLHIITIMFGSSFLFGYNIGVLNQPSTLIKSFYNETYLGRNETVTEQWITFLWSLTTTMFLPGGIIGAFSVGWLADNIGRKKALWVSHLFAFGGAVVSSCCVVANSPAVLMVGRFITGINCGMAVQLGPMYSMEIVPFNMKGATGTACQLFVTLGIFVGCVLGLSGLLGTATLWPFLLLLNAIPAAICMVLMFFLPDSPRYLLIIKGDFNGAEKAIQFDYQKSDVSVEMEEMQTESKMTEKTEKFTIIQLLRTSELLRPLCVACMLQAIQQLSGINAIFFYSSQIFEQAGIPVEKIQYCNLIPTALNVLMTIITVPLMDKAGRRPLLLIPMVIMVIVLATITAALNLQEQVHWMSYVSIVCVSLYVICFAVGLGPIPWLIGAELFRQGPRSTAMSVAGMTNWLFTILVALTFPSIQSLIHAYTFIIFLILMIFFIIFVYFFVPETKDKTFEEVASQFQPGPAIEVEEIIDEVFEPESKIDQLNTDEVDFTVSNEKQDDSKHFDDSDHNGKNGLLNGTVIAGNGFVSKDEKVV